MLHILLSFYIASVITFAIFLAQLSVELIDAVIEEFELDYLDDGSTRFSMWLGLFAVLFFTTGIVPVYNICFMASVIHDRDDFIDRVMDSVEDKFNGE